MAGKVLSGFTTGFTGTVSRAIDNIIEAFPNRGAELAYGTAVVFDPTKSGVKAFSGDSAAVDFIGFAIRSGSKTPNTYGASRGSYLPGETAEVLTRGSIVLDVLGGTPEAGGTVYLVKATGAVTAAADGENTVELPCARFRGPADAASRAEIVLTTRNLI